MRTSRTAALVILILSNPLVYGAELEQWIYSKVVSDQELLSQAIAGENGRDLALLENSTRYIPFFTTESDLPSQLRTSAPSGGYLLRIPNAKSTFYALSSGYWEGSAWFNPSVGREVKINPFDLYVAQDQQNWSYATLITGVPPELIIYDANGTQMKVVSFDLNDPEIENAIASSITSLGQVEKPVVEKILLSEYLNGENNSWRPLDLSDGFNLRNQHQNEAEKNRIDNSPQLTRDRAKELLVENYGVQATQKPKPPSVSLEKNKSKSTFFWIWVGAVAIIISVIVLLMA